MSQPEMGYSVVRKVSLKPVVAPQEDTVDVVSTPPDLELSLESIGESLLGGHCTKQVGSFQTPSPSSYNIAVSDSNMREDRESHSSGYDDTDRVYSNSISSLLFNLSGINTQEHCNTNKPPGMLERSLSMNQREVIITEILGSARRDIKTSTIKHVLGCVGNTHRILAKLVDVHPKELSKINFSENNGITLILEDNSGDSLKANISGSVDKQPFFDYFDCDRGANEITKLVQIGALFEYITGKVALFKDCVIHEEIVQENNFLLDLCVYSKGKDCVYDVLNTRFKSTFMVYFCWHLLQSKEDILEQDNRETVLKKLFIAF